MLKTKKSNITVQSLKIINTAQMQCVKSETAQKSQSSGRSAHTAAAIVVRVASRIAVALLRTHRNRSGTSATAGALTTILDTVRGTCAAATTHNNAVAIRSWIAAVLREVRATVATRLALAVAPAVTIGGFVSTDRRLSTAVDVASSRATSTISTTRAVFPTASVVIAAPTAVAAAPTAAAVFTAARTVGRAIVIGVRD